MPLSYVVRTEDLQNQQVTVSDPFWSDMQALTWAERECERLEECLYSKLEVETRIEGEGSGRYLVRFVNDSREEVTAYIVTVHEQEDDEE